MKLHQSLEQIFKYRLLSNDQIAPYMKKVSQLGKFDQVKMNAVVTEILVRLAKIEDDEEVFTDLKYQADRALVIGGDGRDGELIVDETYEVDEPIDIVQTGSNTLSVSKNPTWKEVRAKARELGVFKPGLKRNELESLIASKMV